MKTIPSYLLLINMFFSGFCSAQSEGNVNIKLESTWDGTYFLYNSRFALVDSCVIAADVPGDFSFNANKADFYFIASRRGNKVYREFINLYLLPNDSLKVVSNKQGLFFSGKATYLNDFALGERYGFSKRYLDSAYDLEPKKASALFDSMRYERENYLKDFVLQTNAPALFSEVHKEQIYHIWCNDYMNYMTYHNYYAHDVFTYLSADSLPINLKDSLRFNTTYNYTMGYHKYLKSYIEMRFHETTSGLNDSLKYEFPMRNYFDLIEAELKGIDKEIAYEAFAMELAFRMRDIDQSLYFKTISPAADLMSISKNEYLKYAFMTQYNALQSIVQGKPAYNFTLKNLNDKNVSLSDYRGKIVYLNFWGTWCGPCIASVPKQIEVHKKYLGKDIVFLNVALEIDSTNVAEWKKFVAEKEYTGEHLVAEKQFYNKELAPYLLNSAPTYMIIGRQGEIIETRTNAPYANIALIDELLKPN